MTKILIFAIGSLLIASTVAQSFRGAPQINPPPESDASTQCQDDLQFIQKMVARIGEDIERRSVNDFVNDIWYLNQQLPQSYNDCTVSGQYDQLVQMYVSSAATLLTQACGNKITSFDPNSFSNSTSNLQLVMQLMSFASQIKSCLSQY